MPVGVLYMQSYNLVRSILYGEVIDLIHLQSIKYVFNKGTRI